MQWTFGVCMNALVTVCRRVNGEQWKKVEKSIYSVSVKIDAAVKACRTSLVASSSAGFQKVSCIAF